jgi:DNA processing protein
MSIVLRDVMLALSMRCHGDWQQIYETIRKKELVDNTEIQKAYEKEKAFFLSIGDKDYPAYFQDKFNPPFLLYYYGNKDLLTAKYRLTAVGTRNPTIYQSDMVYQLIQETEEDFASQLVIVSGMAKGLDQAAMEAAISKKAPVIAVIGSGIDNPYPKENKAIYDYCKEGKGLVLSEYPLSEEPKPEYFLFRNRLLAMMSEIMFVGGGRTRSGTSASVRFALDLNRDILALPCNVTGDDLTNSLINDGARGVLTHIDITDGVKECYGGH